MKKKHNTHRRCAALALLLALGLTTGCAQSAAVPAAGATTPAAGLQGDTLFTNRDLEIGYEESESVAIRLEGDSASSDGPGVAVEGSVITIGGAGVYVLSGSLTNGQIIVDADKQDKIQLVLDGVDINCDTSAALYIRQADKVVVTLQNDTESRLSNQADFVAIDENSIDAVLFSKEDLTLNGNGALTIEAVFGHGVVSKDDLTVAGGDYHVTAAGHGLAGKDNVKIADGAFVITAGKDGIHSENKDDATLGYIYVGGGSFDITSGGDGLAAAATLQVEDGSFNLYTGAGSSGTVADDVSAKGLKAGGDLILRAGRFGIDSTDDALHSNANLFLEGGEYTIQTGDDGIHADGAVAISGGSIDISKSYEGIEGKTIDITGGDLSVVSSDDGLNAAGGQDQSGMGGRMAQDTFAASSGAYIHIAGGRIVIDAKGDGIDSNGSLTVSGGECYVTGPADSGNSALDCDGAAIVTGGIVVAVGQGGMAQSFGASSTQGSILYGLEATQSGEVSLTDTSGKTLVSFTPTRQYNAVVISLPQLTQGESYTLTTAESSQQITMESLSYTGGSVSGQGMGGMGGGRGGMTPPDGTTTPPAQGQRPARPEGEAPAAPAA